MLITQHPHPVQALQLPSARPQQVPTARRLPALLQIRLQALLAARAQLQQTVPQPQATLVAVVAISCLAHLRTMEEGTTAEAVAGSSLESTKPAPTQPTVATTRERKFLKVFTLK